ncbi:MAG: helix-turn-helix transcriptional regulator [Chitinophagaceae bacterium]
MEKLYKIEITAFGKRIKTLRLKKGLTQLDLEVRSGITRTEISKIENGLNNVRFYTIVRLAESLEVELSDFFNGG